MVETRCSNSELCFFFSQSHPARAERNSNAREGEEEAAAEARKRARGARKTHNGHRVSAVGCHIPLVTNGVAELWSLDVRRTNLAQAKLEKSSVCMARDFHGMGILCKEPNPTGSRPRDLIEAREFYLKIPTPPGAVKRLRSDTSFT